MEPAGRLYVPGAVQVREAMGRLVGAAREAGIVHVASADDHDLTDPEISDDPDFDATYPPHCIRGTPGALRIPETEQADPLTLGLAAQPPDALRTLVAGRREILLLKKSTSVFTNPNAESLVAILDPEEIVVFGVATDVCDHATIVGLLGRGRRVAFVEDAARGLSEERTVACIAGWRERGVRLTTTDEVVAALRP
jgi:nicotinamidase/pyrazinamidase